MTKKGIILIGGALAIALLVWGAASFRRSNSFDQEKVRITTSIYPLVFISERIGGERVAVTSVIPSGVEAHDFEPTAQDLIGLVESDLVVLNGRGLEAWAEKFEADLDPGRTRLIYASRDLPVASNNQDEEEDPHVWLDPSLLRQMAKQVAAALVSIDPSGASDYEKNLADLELELTALESDFETGLEDCSLRTFITSHAAFGYLAAAYNLEQLAISGLEPSDEPSANQLAELAQLAKEKEIHYVFFETTTSPELAEVLASEVGAATLVLNPLESLSEKEKQAGQDYLSEMRNNLNNLRMALECQAN